MKKIKASLCLVALLALASFAFAMTASADANFYFVWCVDIPGEDLGDGNEWFGTATTYEGWLAMSNHCSDQGGHHAGIDMPTLPGDPH